MERRIFMLLILKTSQLKGGQGEMVAIMHCLLKVRDMLLIRQALNLLPKKRKTR